MEYIYIHYYTERLLSQTYFFFFIYINHSRAILF